MLVKRYETKKNELGGIHVQEIVEEVPDEPDYNKIFLDKFEDLIERQKLIAEKLGVSVK